MRILVTNDDGIMAPGLRELARQMSRLGEVTVVAPSVEKSAIGHGITIWDPIRLKKVAFPGVREAFSVDGTPADCVKLGIQELLGGSCDLVVSGINNGPNLGTDVLYSGTVSAAIEGAVLRIPSIALSLASHVTDDYTVAGKVALVLGRALVGKNNKEVLFPDTLLNVNIPPVGSYEELHGFRVTRLGVREYNNVFDKRSDPRGNVYYWLCGEVVPHGREEPDLDVVAVEDNYVSVTPLHFDLTDYRIMQRLKDGGIESLITK